MSDQILPYPPRLLSLQELQEIAILSRKHVLEMLLAAGSGHSAGSLGMADVFTALYFHVLRHSPKHPDWPERDRVVLSNGHICPIWYTTLALAGYFDMSHLKTLRSINSKLQGHPHYNSIPGIEHTSGLLGQGLSQALGMALSFRIQGKNNRVYCLMSDGEHQEGQTWEAYLFGGNQRLHNVTVLIDRNNIQIDGHIEDVMPLQPLKHKLEAFRWNVLDIDGHNIEAIIDACRQAESTQEQPTAIICNTIPGKGVEFMENMVSWHGKSPNATETRQALENLRTLQGRIWNE